MHITQAELKEILDYNQETGVFTWKAKVSKSIKVGDIAGCSHHSGNLLIRIEGKNYLAHRLAWLYIAGSLPTDQIDHINGNRSDNRISNLRDVTNRQNQQNRHTHRDGRLVGCYFHKQSKKWRAQIRVNGKQKLIGCYLTELEAHEAYVNALNHEVISLGALASAHLRDLEGV